MGQICKLKFEKWVEREFIEEQMSLAILSAESTFGKPKVRLYAAYVVSKEKSQAAIDVSSKVGEHIAQVFIGLMTRHVGEEKFTVERVAGNQ